ncbi:serine/threonine-protein kinase [Sanguibacter hominis]|uniref:serine/threonine-protein kinase n=1 Tax=Sanguibacter hominis TaxID=1312739 RepID=UPI001B34A2E9|nr:serine/threonine-protein kinase [Sanguibacter hominis]
MERSERTPGDDVGGYTIVRPLGTGATGTVYVAEDGGGTQVALKVLHPAYAATPDSRDRLLREVASMRKVRDDAFVTVLDAEADGHEAFIVMELVDGPSLEDEVLGGGPFDAEDLLELAEKLARALRSVHAAGLVHRDVKPSNILLAEHGPVLIDFGIAQATADSRLTSHGFVMGTPGYLAPELLDGAEPSPAGDWWGWAAALAFAVTGRAPFGVRPLEAVLGRVRAGEVDLAGAGPLTAEALRGALDPDPARRTSPDEVIEALRDAVGTGEEHELVPTAAPGVPRPVVVTVPLDAASDLPADLVEREGVGPYGEGVSRAPLTGDVPVERTAVLRVPTGVFEQPAADDEDAAEPATVGALPPWQDIVDRDRVPTTALPADGPGRTLALPQHDDTGAVPPPDLGAAARREPDPDEHGSDEHGMVEPEPEPEHELEHDGYERPHHGRRPVALLALAAPLCALAGLFPVATFIGIAILVLLLRSVSVTTDALHTRREERGVRRGDALRAAGAYPWYLLRALTTMIPGLLVAASVTVTVLGTLWWLLQTNRWVPVPRGEAPAAVLTGGVLRGPDGEVVAALGTQNASWVFVVALAVTALVTLLVLWFGPMSWPARDGARTLLGHLAPGRGGTVFAVLVGIALTALLVLWAVVDKPIVWWPFGGPPDLS